jgi:hypothetical protein
MELQSSVFRIAFTKNSDRFHCAIGLVDGSNIRPLLGSIEGDESIAWPPSPPWQQIVKESVGQEGRSVLLGVGQSGTGHWSISVDEQSHGALLMDVACKTSSQPVFLGSSWRLEPDWNVVRIESHHVCVESSKTGEHLDLHANHGEFSTKSADSIREFTIHPLPPVSHNKPYRWAMLIGKSDRHQRSHV